MIKRLTGVVVSDKMDKSIVVAVSRIKRHPLYRKQYTITRKFVAHDPENVCKVGDTVDILETPKISKRKNWIVDTKSTKKVAA